jgi:hypothetical protein
MGWFEVTCNTTVPLAPYDQPDNFVVTYTGKVVHVEEGEQETEAGHFTLYRVLRGLALDYRQNLFEVCDAHSQLLHDTYAALFNPETGDLKKRILREFECLEADLLILDELTLAPQWRGLRLGLLVLRRLIDLHESGCGLVVCRPYPSEGAETPEQVRVGRLKLRRYVRQLGFRPVGKTGFYALSTSQKTPRFEDLLRPET